MSVTNWGNITWTLFHTLAEKIRERDFPIVKNLFIQFIKDTCQNLPCPICANHASETLKQARFNLIVTKADMIEFLRQFHNIVNIRVGYPIVEKDFVIKKYKTGILYNMVNNFNLAYSHKYGNFEVNSFHQSNMRQNYLKHANNMLANIGKYCN
tara:strand:+ start:2613 stop:3074 length:462 start_codon:yes stop_codon:yes gene_type:complete